MSAVFREDPDELPAYVRDMENTEDWLYSHLCWARDARLEMQRIELLTARRTSIEWNEAADKRQAAIASAKEHLATLHAEKWRMSNLVVQMLRAEGLV